MVVGGLEPIPPVIGQKQGTPWTGRQFITDPHGDKQLYTLTLTPRVNLESPINLTF